MSRDRVEEIRRSGEQSRALKPFAKVAEVFAPGCSALSRPRPLLLLCPVERDAFLAAFWVQRGQRRERRAKEGKMSEERPRRHPEEPAEGGEEDVEAPGTERARGEEAPGGDAPEEAPQPEHPEEPAEGGGRGGCRSARRRAGREGPKYLGSG